MAVNTINARLVPGREDGQHIQGIAVVFEEQKQPRHNHQAAARCPSRPEQKPARLPMTRQA